MEKAAGASDTLYTPWTRFGMPKESKMVQYNSAATN